MKRRLTQAMVAAALAPTLPGAASAGAPVGGCPTGAEWHLIYPQHQPQAADHNGDGWLCTLNLNAEQGGVFGRGFTFFDNVVREG